MTQEGFDYQAAVKDFQEDAPVWKQIWRAIRKEMWPNRKNWFGFAFSFLFGIGLACVVAHSEDTVVLTGKICGILLDAQIAIFGCIFAVYSILLAFLSDAYMKKLLQTDYHNRTNYLKESTRYYEAALFIYFVAIGASLIYKLTVECMPERFILTNNNYTNEILAGVLLLAYFVYSIRAIYELKSIVGNTLLLFRTSIQFKILAFEEEELKNR